MVDFKFPKLQKKAKEAMVNFLNTHNELTKRLKATDREPYIQAAEKKTIHCAGFRDCLYTGFVQDGAKELQKYLKSSEIVEHLQEHIKNLNLKFSQNK